MHPEHPVSTGDAIADERADGRVHSAGGGANVENGEVVAGALTAGGDLARIQRSLYYLPYLNYSVTSIDSPTLATTGSKQITYEAVSFS